MKTHSFEGGVDGATLLTTDVNNGDPWDAITIGAGNTLTYDRSHQAHQSQCGNENLAASVSTWMAWTTLGANSDWYGRLYFYASAFPTTGATEVIFRTYSGGTAGTAAWRLCVTASPGPFHLAILNGAGTVTWATGTFSLQTSTWYRVEWHAVESTTAASYTVRFYANYDDPIGSETETLSSGFVAGAVASVDTFRLGAVSASHWWFDDIVAAAPAWPGPFPVASAIHPKSMPLGV